MVAAAIGIGSAVAGVAGSALSSSAASSAAKDQQQSAQQAENLQNAQWQYSQQQELPYIQAGDNAETREQVLLDNYNNTVTPYLSTLTGLGNSTTAQAALAQTPGYQFALNQGLQATQNSNAAQGLGVSGAALKGAANYATGLANNTYQQQYQNALSNYNAAANSFSNQFNANNNLATLGEGAAIGAGAQTQQAASNQTGLITGAGNAAAAGTVGSANALAGGLNGLGNSAVSGFLLNNLLSSNTANAGNSVSGLGNNAV